MLPEVGASELIVLAVVALIVVGPKDLPVLLRKIGKFVSKMRGLAADFRSSFDEMARQSELDELRKEVEALRTARMEPLTEDIEAQFDEVHSRLTAPISSSGPNPAGEHQSPPMSDLAPEPVPQPLPEAAADPLPAPAAEAESASGKPVKKPRSPRKPKAEAGS